MIIQCDKCGRSFNSWDGFCWHCSGSEKKAQIENAKTALLYKTLRELARLLCVPFEKCLDKLEMSEAQREDLLYLHEHQDKIDMCISKMRALPSDQKNDA